MNWNVQLHVYDISGGLAHQFSPMFLGKQIDGIYHTGVVVYGKEYYYGGGICSGYPGQTPYGIPVKKEDLGTTTINQETFEEYLESISKDFSMETYDLFDKNCNHFTDEAVKFLVGKPIPDYISGLPKEILNTPFGAIIKPIVDSFTKSLQQQSSNNSAPSMLPQMFEGSNNPQNLFNNQQLQQCLNSFFFNQFLFVFEELPKNTTDNNFIKELKNLEEFMTACEQSEGMVLNCYSASCPPCQTIKPIYSKLAQDYKTLHPQIQFYSADVNIATDIGESLDVVKIPTFFIYKGMDLIEQFSAPDESSLKKKMENFAKQFN